MNDTRAKTSIHVEAKSLLADGEHEKLCNLLLSMPRPVLIRDVHLCLMTAGALARLCRTMEAMRLLEEAKPHFYSSSDANALRRWQNGYAVHLTHLGKIDDAKNLLYESLRTAEMSSDYRVIAYACNTLGNLAGTLGECDSGIQYYGRSLAAWRMVGNEHGVGLGLYNMGIICREWGRLAEATKYFFLAEEYVAESSTEEERILMGLERTVLTLALGDTTLARWTAARLLAKATRLKSSYLVTRAHKVTGAVLLAEGGYGEARGHLELAREGARVEPNLLLEAEANEDLAVLAFLERRFDEGSAYRSACLGYYSDIGAAKHFTRCDRRLQLIGGPVNDSTF